MQYNKQRLKNKTMEIKWIVIVLVLICVVGLVVYLIVQNEKDKNDLMNELNETESGDEPKPKEEEEEI